MKCVNKNSKEFKALSQSTGLSEFTLATRIGKWQEANNSNEFPTFNELLGVAPSSFIIYGNNPELELIGSDVEFGQYVNKTGDSSIDGFIEYQQDKTFTPVTTFNIPMNVNLSVNDISKSKPSSFKPFELYNKADVDNELKKTYLNGKEFDDVKASDMIESLSKLDPTNTSDSTLTLLSRLNSIKEISNIDIKFVDNSKLGDNVAYWDSTDNAIYTSKEAISDMTGEEVIQMLLHELVHAKVAASVLDPQTAEEKELQSLIRKFIKDYSSLSQSYGFTNEMEFVAELYSNRDFANEVNNLYNEKPVFKNVFSKILDAIRRLFNMSKPNQFDKLMEAVVLNVEVSTYRSLRGDYGIFHLQKGTTSSYVGYINKMDRISETMLDNLLKRKKHVQTFSKSQKDIKLQIEELDKRIEAIEASENLEKGRLILSYSQDLVGLAHSAAQDTLKLKSSIRKPETVYRGIKRNKNLLSLLDMMEDVNGLIRTIKKDYYSSKGVFKKNFKNEIDQDLAELILEIEPILNEMASLRHSAENNILDLQQILAEKIIANKDYLQVIEYEFKQKYIKQYNNEPSLKETYPTVDKYIVDMFKKENKIFKQALLDKAKDLIENPYLDMSYADLNLFDYLSVDSGLFNIVTNMMNEMSMKIKQSFRPWNAKLSKSFDNFNKFNNSLNQREKFKNLLVLNKENNRYYLQGKYKHEVLEAYLKASSEVYERLYSENKKFSLTEEEFTTLENVGVQSLYRSNSEHGVLEGDVINMRKNDEKTSSINSKVRKVVSLKALDTLSNEEMEYFIKTLGFTSLEELKDSKIYAGANTEHSRVNKAVYEYLQNPTKGSLDIIQYTRIEKDDTFEMSEQPEILEYYKKYMEVKTSKKKDETGEVYEVEEYYVKDQYLDSKYEALSDAERDALNKASEITYLSNKVFGKVGSLVKEIPKVVGYEALMYPSMEQSELEMRGQGDFKKILKDQAERLKTTKNDEIDQGQSRDYKGDVIHRMKPHYRKFVNPEDVSFSFYDTYMKELEQAVHHQHRTAYIDKVTTLIDIASNKQYYKEEKGKIALNRNNKHNKELRIPGENSNEVKKMKGALETHMYGIHSHNDTYWSDYQATKVVGVINGLAASVALTLNEASGVANILNGMAQLHLDAIGKADFSLKNLTKAEGIYTKDMINILGDLTKSHKTSLVNQLVDEYNVLGGVSLAEQEYIKNNFINKFGSTGMMNIYNESGEHMMTSILTMAILDNIKVLNKEGQFINKEGQVVNDKAKAASLLDMHSVDPSTGLLTLHKDVEFTTHTYNTSVRLSTGKSQISMLITKRSFDLFGVFNTKLQGEIAKKWYGKSVMMFKRFFISGLQHRWKGAGNITKHPNEMSSKDKTFSNSLKRYEEGYYTTFLKFMGYSIVNLKKEGLKYSKEYYNNLTVEEQANIRKATAELVLTTVIIPTLGFLLATSFDDDDEKPYFLMYQVQRLSMELGQFYNPLDLTKITSNPVAGMRFIQNSLKLARNLVTPINLDPQNNEQFFDYLSEDIHGKNKLVKDFARVTPVWTRFYVDYADMFNSSGY